MSNFLIRAKLNLYSRKTQVTASEDGAVKRIGGILAKIGYSPVRSKIDGLYVFEGPANTVQEVIKKLTPFAKKRGDTISQDKKTGKWAADITVGSDWVMLWISVKGKIAKVELGLS